MYVELRELTVCRNDMEAHIIKGLLQENDIEVYIRKDDCGGMEPQLQITEGIKVMVPSDQFKKAKSLLDDFQEQYADAENKQVFWECPGCGEKLEGQFSVCWKCETPKESVDS